MSARKQQGKYLSVVSSPPPPAKPPARAYADFDKWLDLAAELESYGHEVREIIARLKSGNDPAAVMEGSRLLASRPRDKLAAQVAKVIEGEEFYNRDELYDWDHEGDSDAVLFRRVIAEQVGLLLGSYPNAVPHDPEAFVLMMIEEIARAEPSAIDLERACRSLRRTLKFPPTIPEMLEAIEKARSDYPPVYLCRVMTKGEEAVILERRKALEAAVTKAEAALGTTPA
jgi:hypothetical protein